ncbi:glycosyltransferase family 4 protein [Kribbella solani]|uniref:glycosyltransferase family 4 protein n=1 Tax=Kribbella solani TaxID=236067 RepID=UPI0029AE6E8C|nr:glycosyltransferase family 4 protein [Kribbella solani]MDX2972171.1 glycosyltransferase family 4 protein [Kribbella solani]
MVHSILSRLASRGHEVTVYVIPQSRNEAAPAFEEYVHQGIHVVTCSLVDLNRHAMPRRPEIVIGQLGASPFAAKIAQLASAKYVDVVHDCNSRTIRNLVICKPSLAICNTPLVRDLVKMHCSDSTVVRPPVDPSIHATGRGDLATLVNLNKNKGVELFYRIAEAMPHVDFLGVIGGYGEQETRGRPINVEIQEHTADMRAEVWSRTRVLLVPSQRESYAMVSLEAAASGIPVIANAIPGIREAMGGCAVYLNKNDTDLWVDTINRIYTDGAFEARLSALSVDRSRAVYERTRHDIVRGADKVEALAR